jgi:ribonuclease HI
MIIYYTDGSCSPNPGPGGYAVIKDTKPLIVGNEELSTNIRMEGKAMIAALRNSAGQECQIYTDSEFWVNVLTKWGKSWQANGWKKKGGDIKNLELVQEAHDLYVGSKAELVWVRGHVGNVSNELADVWANKAREEKLDGVIAENE